MRLGICGSTNQADVAKAAGWMYIEENVQGLLQGQTPDDQWDGASRVAGSALPVSACNMLVPGGLKITGPTADRQALKAYMGVVLRRAGLLGIKTLVFGSGGARQVPDGFGRTDATGQIRRFLEDAAPLAADSGVTLVIEPLNRKECNIINSVAEAMELVRNVNHPSVECLLDTYHFWLEDESLAHLVDAGRHIRHVHLADRDGRVAPGLSLKADYRPVFRILKDCGYDGLISFEGAAIPAFEQTSPKVIEFVHRQWQEA